MPVTHTLAAAFTQSIGKAISLPAGTTTMVFFGTGGDGIESNRVVGGPALSVLQGTPAHATNYVSVGLQASGTRNDVIDTNNPRTAAWITSGWTGMAVARAIGAASVPASIISEQNMTPGSPGQAGNDMGIGLQANVNRLTLYGNGVSNRGIVQLTRASDWHVFAYTVPAGAASGTPTMAWEFTENQAGASVSFNLSSTLAVPVPAMSPHFGAHSVEGALSQGPIDIAWGMITQAVLSQATMAALAASVRPWLARRGIVC
jgi:hypothetical protein